MHNGYCLYEAAMMHLEYSSSHRSAKRGYCEFTDPDDYLRGCSDDKFIAGNQYRPDAITQEMKAGVMNYQFTESGRPSVPCMSLVGVRMPQFRQLRTPFHYLLDAIWASQLSDSVGF